MKTITAVAAVVASSLNVTAAVAGPAPVEARVSYADLDLNNPEGQQVLEKRLEAAVPTACGANLGERQQVIAIASAGCYRTAVANATAEAAKINPTMFASR